MEQQPDWNQRYIESNTPWDSGRPSSELQRVLDEFQLPAGRVLELGCGTGTNAIYLATRGFEVTAVDISEEAVGRARQKATEASVAVDFHCADATQLPELGEPFPFVFDRGVYHVLRRNALQPFLNTLARVSAVGGHYLTLAGNANDRERQEEGPPRVSAADLCAELAPLFDLVQLREFYFDEVEIEGQTLRPLAWSALSRGAAIDPSRPRQAVQAESCPAHSASRAMFKERSTGLLPRVSLSKV